MLLLLDKTGGIVRVLWNEASFVDANGDAHPIVHESKAAFDERGHRKLEAMQASIRSGRAVHVVEKPDESPAPTSSVVPGARANEYVYPADFIAGGDRKALLPEGGDLLGIPGRNEPSLEEVKADVQRRSGALVGKTFELYLPIDTGDGTVDYLFTFRIIGETSKVQ